MPLYRASMLTSEKVIMSLAVLKAAFAMPSVPFEEKTAPSIRQEKLASPVESGCRKATRQNIKKRVETRILKCFAEVAPFDLVFPQ